MDIDGLIFVGIVSTIAPENGTVRVMLPDKDNRTTDDLIVLQRGVVTSKDYWLPEVGEQVLCMRLPNVSGNGPGTGYVLGSLYNAKDRPVESVATNRSITWSDGSKIQYAGGNMLIKAAGNLTIQTGGNMLVKTGGALDLNP